VATSADFLALGAGSPCIDKGQDIGLPYAGPAPDIGALERSLATGIGKPWGVMKPRGARPGDGSACPGSGIFDLLGQVVPADHSLCAQGVMVMRTALSSRRSAGTALSIATETR
jgi:hypothetical protein